MSCIHGLCRWSGGVFVFGGQSSGPGAHRVLVVLWVAWLGGAAARGSGRKDDWGWCPGLRVNKVEGVGGGQGLLDRWR